MNKQDWSVGAAISTAISFAGLVGIAISEKLRIWYVVGVVLVLFCSSLAVLLMKVVGFLRNIRDSFSDLLTRPYFPHPFKDIWTQKIKNETDFKVNRLDVRISYDDPEGKVVTFTKSQEIVAKKAGVNVIWDTGLRFDGGIDWSTYHSSIGTAEPDRKRKVGATFEVPTYLENPLSTTDMTPRKVSCKVLDSYTAKSENQSLRIYQPTEMASLSVKLFPPKVFGEVKGFVCLACYKEDNIPQPKLMEKDEVVWHLPQPQLNERYIMTWTVTP
jgi:hypothetical protein